MLLMRLQLAAIICLLFLSPGANCYSGSGFSDQAQADASVLESTTTGSYTGKQEDENIKSKLPYAVIDNQIIDLGKIKQGSRSEGHIKLKNEGGRDMVIGRVRGSCGLMIPTWPSYAIAPGEEVTIQFRYDSTRLGKFERNVVIHTNAYQRNIIVKVKGEVSRDF